MNELSCTGFVEYESPTDVVFESGRPFSHILKQNLTKINTYGLYDRASVIDPDKSIDTIHSFIFNWISHSKKQVVSFDENFSGLKKHHRINKIQSQLNILRDCAKLGELKDNWDSYASEAPNEMALRSARDLLLYIFSCDDFPYPSRIRPSVEGGVSIIYRFDKKYIGIECTNEGNIVFGLMKDHNEPVIYEVHWDNMENYDIWEILNEFFFN